MGKSSNTPEYLVPSVVFTECALPIAEAIKSIQGGFCNRVDIGDFIKVYSCQNVIRIDIKHEY